MACKIAENEPLLALRMDLGLTHQCHSLSRDECIHSLSKPEGNFVMGVNGAAIGYCQALFIKNDDPKSHTQKIINLLKSIDAPWYSSHELYWGNRTNQTLEDFIHSSMEPLFGTGRMPILITPLDPAKDCTTIESILESAPPLFDGEPTLVRIVLTNDDSVSAVASLIKNVLAKARTSKEMPKFWPLLQGQLKDSEWKYLRDSLSGDWKYINIAVNPFTVDLIPEFCWPQITVAQVVIGHSDGISLDGDIHIPSDMIISGAKLNDGYNIFKYFRKLDKIAISPTLIILGPSLPSWTDEYNLERISKVLPLLRIACDKLWKSLDDKRKEIVWNLSA